MTERRKNDRRIQDYLMTEGQVAEFAKVSANTVRHWRQAGMLPFVKVGKYPRIWASVFYQVFQKPLPYPAGSADTITSAGDIRRQS
jgi:hypothetical protein